MMNTPYEQVSNDGLESPSLVPNAEDIPRIHFIHAESDESDENLRFGRRSACLPIQEENLGSSVPRMTEDMNMPSSPMISSNSDTAAMLLASNDNRDEKRSMRPSVLRYMLKCWLWEICGIVLSVTSIIAVIILAAHLDGTLLSDWQSIFSPNTVISALVTLAKTSMLPAIAEGLSQAKWLYFWKKQRPLSNISVYEDASRGPWGSFMFLRLGWRRNPPVLACVGAFVTILALAMGPSLQQIVAFDAETVPQTGTNSSILVTKSYSSSRITNERTLQRALADGLLTDEISLGYSCQSGNCSWPEFTTLGFCSSCVDVSDVSQITAEYIGSADLNLNIYPLPDPLPDGAGVSFTVDTPSGFQLKYRPRPILENLFAYLENETDYIYFGLTAVNTVETQVRFAPSWDDLYASLAVIQQGETEFTESIETSGNRSTTALKANATVTECTIRWCARTYRYFKVIQNEQVDYVAQEHPLGIFNITEALIDVAEFYVIFRDDTQGPGVAPIYPFGDSTFRVSQFAAQRNIGSALGSNFATSGAVNSTAGIALRYGTNVSERVAILADSLTKWIQDSDESIQVPGTTWVQATVIHIRWGWLTIPIVSVVLSTIFLLLTMIGSLNTSLPMWKSSPLPLLFLGVEEWNKAEARDMLQHHPEEKGDMKKRAKAISARLVRRNSGTMRFTRNGTDG